MTTGSRIFIPGAHAEMTDIPLLNTNPRIIDHLSPDKLKEVYFFPYGRDSDKGGALGDTMLDTLSPALNLSLTFPRAQINVINPMGELFKGHKRLNQIIKPIDECLREGGEGTLIYINGDSMVGLENQNLDGFIKRGGVVVHTYGGDQTLYKGGVGPENKLELPAIEYPENPYIHYTRTRMDALGFQSCMNPTLNISPEEQRVAEKKLITGGFRPPGDPTRVHLVSQAHCHEDDVLGVKPTKDLVEGLLGSGADVLIDPGKDGGTREKLIDELTDHPHLYLPLHLPLREMMATMNCMDVVITPNTGSMWVAAGLGKTSLTYTSGGILSKSYCPDVRNTFQFINQPGAIKQGYQAVKLLQSGNGLDAFHGRNEMVQHGKEYVKILSGFDPASQKEQSDLLVRAEWLRNKLSSHVKPEYRKFLLGADPESFTRVHSHQQDPLYRYLRIAFQEGKSTLS